MQLDENLASESDKEVAILVLFINPKTKKEDSKRSWSCPGCAELRIRRGYADFGTRWSKLRERVWMRPEGQGTPQSHRSRGTRRDRRWPEPVSEHGLSASTRPSGGSLLGRPGLFSTRPTNGYSCPGGLRAKDWTRHSKWAASRNRPGHSWLSEPTSAASIRSSRCRSLDTSASFALSSDTSRDNSASCWSLALSFSFSSVM